MGALRRLALPFALPLALGLALLGLSVPASAALRCGVHLISEGDTAGELHARCGPPAEVERKTGLRPPVIWMHGRPVRVGDGDIEVTIEFWTYNFGPNQLMRRVKLEDGRVKEIETLGHGYY